jgi:hypothetical protein
MEARDDEPTRWRGRLRRDVALLIALKVAALALLWALFFSPAARVPVDGASASRQLGLTHRESAPPRAFRSQAPPSVSASSP